MAATFALVTPIDIAAAQNTNATPDGDGEYKDGEYEGEMPKQGKKDAKY